MSSAHTQIPSLNREIDLASHINKPQLARGLKHEIGGEKTQNNAELMQ
jgi:hypothetical protein